MRSSLKYASSKGIDKAVEVGVRDGENALEILKEAKFLYLVDPYIRCEETWETGRKVISQKFQNLCKETMLRRIEPFKNTEFLELTSLEASKRFEGKTFDYIYIDADHTYNNVLDDLKAWYPKLKDNGVLAGHDFQDRYPGVIEGVIDFANLHNLKVVYNGDTDWWFKKKKLRVVSYLHVQPFKPYRKMAQTLERSAIENGYEFSLYSVSAKDIGVALIDDKLYIKCQTRPTFIKKALEDFKDDLVWMDVDCVIKKPLGEVLNNCDVAVTLRSIEDRQSNHMEKFKFINSGVIFFKNNGKTRKFCDLWQSNISGEDCDQDGLNNLLLKYSKLEKYDEIIDVEGVRVKILEARIYNFFYFPEDSSEAKVLHYKGFSWKKENMYVN